MLSQLFKIGCLAFGGSVIVTPFIIFLAKKFKIVSKAQNDRWSIEKKPLLGGIAFWFIFIVCSLLFLNLSREILFLLVCSTMIFLLGLIDEIFHLNPHIKLVVQVICASLIIKAGYIANLGGLPFVASLITIIWIVGLTNSFNLLDNMDGLAGGIVAIVSFIFCIIFLKSQLYNMALMSVILGGSALGFLVFNFYPSKIFMGDSGSLFLGFLTSIFAIEATRLPSSPHVAGIIVPLLILAVPLFDTFFVMVTRFLRGIPLMQGGRDHISHHLMTLGLTQRSTALTLYGIVALCGFLALMRDHFSPLVTFAITCSFAVVFYYMGSFLFQRVQESFLKKTHNKNSVSLRRVVEIGCDLILVSCSFYVVFYLHYEGVLTEKQSSFLYHFFPWVIAVRLLFFIFIGLYEGIWRYMGFNDVFSILKGGLGGTLALLFIYYIRYKSFHSSVSAVIFFFEFVLTFFLIAGSRCGWRILWKAIGSLQKAKVRTLIIGTEFQAMMALENLRQLKNNIHVLGFLSPDETKKGVRIQGYPVVGNVNDFSDFLYDVKVDQVIWAQRPFDKVSYNTIKNQCAQKNIAFKKYISKVVNITAQV